MDSALARRLGAADVVVTQSAGTPEHKAVSRVQAHALAAFVKKASLTPDALAEVAERVQGIPWFGNDRQELLMCLIPAKVGPGRPQRRSMQNYMALIAYLTPSEWDVLMSTEISVSKLHIILDKGLRLGMRTPAEPTLKFLMSFWIVVSESAKVRVGMSSNQKANLLMFVKKEFHRKSRCAGDAVYYVQQLPGNPLDLQNDSPELWKYAFPDELPVPAHVSLAEVAAFDNTFSCRERKCSPTGVGFEGQVPEDMGRLLERLLNWASGDRSAPSPGGSGNLQMLMPPNLSQSRASTHRLPTLTFTQTPLRASAPAIDNPPVPPVPAIEAPPVPKAKVDEVTEETLKEPAAQPPHLCGTRR